MKYFKFSGHWPIWKKYNNEYYWLNKDLNWIKKGPKSEPFKGDPEEIDTNDPDIILNLSFVYDRNAVIKKLFYEELLDEEKNI